MLLAPFHSRLLHHSPEPDPAGTPYAAQDPGKSLSSPFHWHFFPACVRTKRLPCPLPHRDGLVLPPPNKSPISKASSSSPAGFSSTRLFASHPRPQCRKKS